MYSCGRYYTMKDGFNDTLDTLKIKPTVELIIFNDTYNIPVTNELVPKHVTHLYFGKRYNQPVNNLPDNIVKLMFGYDFNQSVDNLPPNLKSLYIHGYGNFNKSFDKLPASLKYLSLPFRGQPLDNLPDGLLKLNICNIKMKCNIIKLPANLKVLNIYGIVFNMVEIKVINNGNITHCTLMQTDRMCFINRHNIQKRQMGLFDDLSVGC